MSIRRETKRCQVNRIRFNALAAALICFLSNGWNMYFGGGTSSGSGCCGSGRGPTSCGMFIKPCIKEEFDKFVE